VSTSILRFWVLGAPLKPGIEKNGSAQVVYLFETVGLGAIFSI
jgi:hypothetical protein